MKSLVEEARDHCKRADTVFESKNDRISAIRLYLDHYTKAAKCYLRAAEEVSSASLRASLIYLSTNCMRNILTMKQKLTAAGIRAENSTDKTRMGAKGGKISQPEQRKLQNDTDAEDKKREAQREYSEVLYVNRLIHQAHLRRISGISEIPRMSKPSHDVIVQDLLALESKLNEIGLIRPEVLPVDRRSEGVRDIQDSYIDAAISEHGTKDSTSTPHYSGRFTKESTFSSSRNVSTIPRHVSNLGESFMFLDPRNQSEDSEQTPRQSDELEFLQSTTANLINASLLPSWLQLQLLQDRQQEKNQQTHNRNKMSIENSSRSDDTHRIIAWNSQENIHRSEDNPATIPNAVDITVASNSTKGIANVTEGKQSIDRYQKQNHNHQSSRVSESNMDQMTKSTLNFLDIQSKSNISGLLNLLRTVKRLGEENAFLIHKVELLSHVEQQCEVNQKEIMNFKKEYQRKFQSLKVILSEYSTCQLKQKKDSSVTTSNKKLNVQTEDIKIDHHHHHHHHDDESAAGEVIDNKSNIPMKSTTTEVNQRQKQLEKMVKALYTRLEKATDELKSKEAIISKYKKVLAKVPQKDLNTNQLNNEVSTQSTKTAEMMRSQQKAPPVATASGAGGATLRNGVVVATSQVPLKKQLYNMPPNHKHHSTTTLEVLQRSATAKAAMKQQHHAKS